MSPRAALQEGVEHPLQAACGGVVFFQPLIGIVLFGRNFAEGCSNNPGHAAFGPVPYILMI